MRRRSLSPTARLRRASLLALVTSWALGPSAALASSGPHGISIPTGIFVPVGLDLGAAFQGGDPFGLLLGGEISVVNLFDNLWWLGLVGAGRRDFGRDDWSVALGPELGFAWVGAEALVEYREGAWGGRFRLVVPMVFGGPYFGISTAGEVRFEVGALLKFPLGLE